MQTNIRLLLFTSSLLLLFAIAVMINTALNFRSYGYQNAIAKSKTIAEIVRDGLTAHMVNGIMEKRKFFLDKLSSTPDVKRLWVVRGESVVKQFGPGLGNEQPRDEIDRHVLASGESLQRFVENSQSALIRITIPYKASAYDNPNCLACHHVNEGDTLGAISLELDISNVRQEGIFALLKIIGITLLFIFIAVIAIKIFSDPYLQFFKALEQSLKEAHQGNFEKMVSTTIKAPDIQQVAANFNLLLQKFQQTIGNVEHKLATLLQNSQSSCTDPLQKASDTINILSQIHRFKKTIELDSSLSLIYDRIAEIIRKLTKCQTFTIYCVDEKKNIKELLYNTLETLPCHAKTFDEIDQCRAIRTDSLVVSEQFPNLCPYYTGTKPYYHCIPYPINEQFTLVIVLLTDDKEEVEHFNQKTPILYDYLENAKPVIESKLLMERLRQKSLHDGLTGLYNRKFLEEFIDQVTLQSDRKISSYGVLMLDIDFFKKINDSYGHDIGDQFIKKLANTLKYGLRKSDIAARYGGEEFVTLLFETNLENASKLADSIRQRFENETIHVDGHHIKATVSIGVSHFPTQAQTLREAIKYADVALYEAKHRGRNRVVAFDPSMYGEKSY